mgnify:CR=1 FL=1
MADITTIGAARLTGSQKETSLLQRIAARMIAARQDQAQRAVNTYLLSLDDATLERLGYDRGELERTTPGGYPFL